MISHASLERPFWQRWVALSEVWAGGKLSSILLARLRWLAAIGQGVTLWVVWLLGVDVPWAPCALAVGLTLLSNAALEWWLRQTDWQLHEGFFHLMLWDALTLTFLLHWTGGLENPFALFYLVQLTLAAVALRSSAVVSLALLMAGGCWWLWLHGMPLVLKNGSLVPPRMLLQGSMVALVLAGSFILTLLLALRRRSHRLQKERVRLSAELESRERFLSVAALATGFAHELGTPLGTIALAAEELQKEPDTRTAEIILKEVGRCQKVLQRLRELGQEATGLSSAPCLATEVVESALEELPDLQRERLRVTVLPQVKGKQVACAGLREAVLVLLRNALLSSPENEKVDLRLESRNACVRYVVEDRGPGFSQEMLKHWGEPFRSTREPGAGLGLGLFFVRRLAASMHGQVMVGNNPSGGAWVILELPCYPQSNESSANRS